jgi:hypothetical protein
VARARGYEAARVRDFLSQPPLRPADPTAGMLSYVRRRHAAQIEEGLRAYRELLRHLRIAGFEEKDWPHLKPPAGTGQRWSTALTDVAKKLSDLWDNEPAGPKPNLKFQYLNRQLTRPQIDALLSRGLELMWAPGVKEQADDQRLQLGLTTEQARSGRIIAVIVSGKVKVSGKDEPVRLLDPHVRLSAEHQGDRWLAREGLQLTRRQKVAPNRLFVEQPNLEQADVLKVINSRNALLDRTGGPAGRYHRLEGTSLSGTTVLRLEKVNCEEISSLALTVVTVHYE